MKYIVEELDEVRYRLYTFKRCKLKINGYSKYENDENGKYIQILRESLHTYFDLVLMINDGVKLYKYNDTIIRDNHLYYDKLTDYIIK